MAPWCWPCRFTRGLPHVLGFTIIAAVAWIPRHGSLLDLPGRRSLVSSPSPGSGSPRVVTCAMCCWASLIGSWGWGLGRARCILWGSGYFVSWGLCAAISRGFIIVSIGLACTHGICLVIGELLMSSLWGSTCWHWCQIPSKYPWVFTTHLGYDAVSAISTLVSHWELELRDCSSPLKLRHHVITFEFSKWAFVGSKSIHPTTCLNVPLAASPLPNFTLMTSTPGESMFRKSQL